MGGAEDARCRGDGGAARCGMRQQRGGMQDSKEKAGGESGEVWDRARTSAFGGAVSLLAWWCAV